MILGQSDMVTPTQGKSRELKTVARARPRAFFNSLTAALGPNGHRLRSQEHAA